MTTIEEIRKTLDDYEHDRDWRDVRNRLEGILEEMLNVMEAQQKELNAIMTIEKARWNATYQEMLNEANSHNP